MKITIALLVGALSLALEAASAQAPSTFPAPTATDEAAGFDTGLSVNKNPLKCAVPENLIFETSSGFPRTEFFACDPDKLPIELAAVVEYGRKSDTSMERYGISPTKATAEQLQRLFPKDKFLSLEDKTGRGYLGVLKEGLRKKGVSYITPTKMATRK